MKILMTLPASETVLNEIKTIEAKMDELESREESYWAQRSRQDSLRDRDKNNAFFHRKAKQRKKRNTIKGVLDDGGTWRDEEEEIEAVFVSYFKGLFKTGGHQRYAIHRG